MPLVCNPQDQSVGYDVDMPDVSNFEVRQGRKVEHWEDLCSDSDHLNAEASRNDHDENHVEDVNLLAEAKNGPPVDLEDKVANAKKAQKEADQTFSDAKAAKRDAEAKAADLTEEALDAEKAKEDAEKQAAD